jgi:hypothetical protein
VQALAALADRVAVDRVERLVLRPGTTADGLPNFRMRQQTAIDWDATYVKQVVREFERQPSAGAEPVRLSR